MRCAGGPRRILIATRNRGKLREIQAVMRDLPVEWLTLADLPEAPGVNEDGDSFESNADRKALHYAEQTGLWTLADDSGLEVDALGGQPGIRSARFAGEPKSDARNNAKLVALLAGIPAPRRTARFRCVLSVAEPRRILARAAGTLEGLIVDEPRGQNGFGYDPHFLVPELGKTLAELEPDHKNRISHRGRALATLHAVLRRMICP